MAAVDCGSGVGRQVGGWSCSAAARRSSAVGLEISRWWRGTSAGLIVARDWRAWSHSRVWHRKFRRKSSDSESESVAQWSGQREKEEGCLQTGFPPPSGRGRQRSWSGAEGVSSEARRRPAAGRADLIVTAVKESGCPHF
jgi:hypothetical protein